MRRERARRVLACAFAAAFAILAAGCPDEGANSVKSELLKPVSVTISGKVTDAQSGLPVAGALVRVQRLLGSAYDFAQEGSADASATTSADGSFAFAKALSLDVDSYQYFLYLSDPSGAYFDNGSISVYAMRDTALSYSGVKLVSKAVTTYTVVSGRIKDLLDGGAIAGLELRLYRKGESSAAFTALSAADGTFSIPNVPATLYSLELDGSGLATPYIKEASDLVLANSLTNPLGDLRVSKASTGDDLRIVLSWTDPSLDLDSSFSLPVPGFDFNHLGTRQVKLQSSIISVNPAFKFAEGTAYWPENMGGAADATNRVVVNKDKLSHAVSATTIAELDKNSADGSVPEVTTVHKQNPLASFPSKLAYNYDFVKDGTLKAYYPIGMGVFNVICATSTGSIYDSGAKVKVYQGSTYVGTFSVAELAIDSGESNRRYWPVLQVEMGYSASSPAGAGDIYFRVVPYGSAGALPSSRFAGYFYQETALPGNESYTVLLDKAHYDRDYILSPAPYFERVLASASGRIYSYDWNGGLSWKAKASAPSSPRAYTAGFYWGIGAETLYLAQDSGAADSPISTATGASSGLDAITALDSAMADAGLTAGVTVRDACMLRFQSDQSFLLLATDKGPRGAGTPVLAEQSPKLDALQNGWADNTSGAVLSGPSARQLTRTLPMRDRYGAIGGYALIGGQGLFLLNAYYAKYNFNLNSWDTDGAGGFAVKAGFQDIVNMDAGNTCNLSGIGTIVTALAEVPPASATYSFIAAVKEGASLAPKLYQINLTGSGGAASMPGSPHISALPDPGFGINDLMFVLVDREWVLLAATDSGIRLSRSYSTGSWTPYLADMLGGFRITKLFDYDGKLGVFAEGNGLMYGPYPE
jgi:hypothetical protein